MNLKKHKLKLFFSLIIVLMGGYYGYQKFLKKPTPIEYLTEPVQKTTITVSVDGSGQVSDLNKIDLKPLASGEIVETKVKNGDLVKSGQTLAVIDQKDNQVALDQAKASLANDQASLDKLLKGTTGNDIKLQQDTIDQSQTSYNNALANLESVKNSTATSISQAQNTLSDLRSTTQFNPTNKRGAVLTALNDKLVGVQTALDAEDRIFTDSNAKDTLSIQDPASLTSAQNDYNQALQLLSRADISLSLAQGNPTDSNLDQAVNDALGAISRAHDSLNYLFTALQKTITSAKFSQSQLDTFKSSISGQLSAMSSAASAIQTAIQSLKDALTAAENALASAQTSAAQQVASAQAQVASAQNALQLAKDQLVKLKAPAPEQDIDAARAQVASAQAQVENAQNAYNDNIIKAPFDGQIAQINVQKGDQVGATTIVATLITQQKVAVIPLNEVDEAKIKVGDQATLTFDAIDNLTIAGKVAEIDTLGTVSQGVVTYNATIGFDTQDSRVKSGMSANASIITDVKPDVLAVPNAALKTDNGDYVEVLGADNRPKEKAVRIGIANDSLTEIISGLKEGDPVVTQTIDPNAKTPAQTQGQRGGFGFPMGGGGGRGVFVGGKGG